MVATLVLTLVPGADDGVLLQPASASPIDAATRTKRVVDTLWFPLLRYSQRVDAGEHPPQRQLRVRVFGPIVRRVDDWCRPGAAFFGSHLSNAAFGPYLTGVERVAVGTRQLGRAPLR